MKIKKFIFTDYGEIIYVPKKELKVYEDGRCAILLTTFLENDTISELHWFTVLFDSSSPSMCIEYALKYVEEHPKKLDEFIKHLGFYEKIKDKLKVYKKLLEARLCAYIIQERIEKL